MSASDLSAVAEVAPPAGFRRVLVALDSATASGTTLEIAAGIAAANACELSGLFVEDQDLLRLAGLPFACEIQLAKAMTRALVPEQLLRDLRAQAALARTAMARQAGLHRIAWSFKVAQGRSEEAVLLAATAGDIIVIARRFGPLAEVGHLSRRLCLIARRAPGPILLAGERPVGRAGPTLLAYDASPAAEHVLKLAGDLARMGRQPLEIMLLDAAVGQAAELEARLLAAGGAPAVHGLRIWTPQHRATALRRLCEADRGLLVLPADAPCFSVGQVEQIIEQAHLPLVLQTDAASEPG